MSVESLILDGMTKATFVSFAIVLGVLFIFIAIVQVIRKI